MRRGFVFTVYSLLFFSLLLSYAIGWLTFSADSSYQFSEKNPARVAFGLVDNASSAFSTVYPFGLSLDVEKNRVQVYGHFEDYNAQVLDSLSDALHAYAQNVLGLTFLLSDPNWEQKQSVTLVANLASVYRTSGDGDVNTVFEDRGVVGAFSQWDENIRITGVDLNDTKPWSWNPSGDVAVHIVYKDDSITLPLSGRLDSSQPNNYTFEFTDGTFLVLRLSRINGVLRVVNQVRSGVQGDWNASFDSTSLVSANPVFPANISISYANATVDAALPYQPSRH